MSEGSPAILTLCITFRPNVSRVRSSCCSAFRIRFNSSRASAELRFGKKPEPRFLVLDKIAQTFVQAAAQLVDPPLQVECVRYDEFRGSARCRRTQVSNEIGNGEINFVTDRADDWDRIRKWPGNDLLVELPQSSMLPPPRVTTTGRVRPKLR